MVNTAQLDPSLQVGSDVTSSKDNTPIFVIAADGGSAKYECFVDGVRIDGVFTGDPWAKAYVQIVNPIPDGRHVFTFNELSPNPSLPTTPFNFGIDTVPPNPPVVTSVSVGLYDPVRLGHAVIVFGTGLPVGLQVICILNPYGMGGATIDAVGNWRVHAGWKKPNNYTATAFTVDKSGNRSDLSAPFAFVVGTPIPPPPPPVATVPTVPVLVGTNTVTRLSWASTSDGGSPITSWIVRKNGILLSNQTVMFLDVNTPGSYTVAAVNAIGESTQSAPYIKS
jgi:hypothetical protein